MSRTDLTQTLQHLEASIGALVRHGVVERQQHRQALQEAGKGQEVFLLDLLKVMDLLDQQVGFLERQPDEGPWKRLARNLGVARSTLLAALERQGITRVMPEPGSAPDYRVCRAVERRIGEAGVAEAVDEVLQAGYVRGDAVLRQAEVAVRAPEA